MLYHKLLLNGQHLYQKPFGQTALTPKTLASSQCRHPRWKIVIKYYSHIRTVLPVQQARLPRISATAPKKTGITFQTTMPSIIGVHRNACEGSNSLLHLWHQDVVWTTEPVHLCQWETKTIKIWILRRIVIREIHAVVLFFPCLSWSVDQSFDYKWAASRWSLTSQSQVTKHKRTSSYYDRNITNRSHEHAFLEGPGSDYIYNCSIAPRQS